MESTKRKLEASERKELMKKSGPEADVIRSTLLRSKTPEADVIRSIWRSSGAERLKNFKCCSNEVWSCLSLQKIGRIKQRLSRMDLKALDTYSVESVEKGHFYEGYNHYLHYSVFMSASKRTTVVPATVFLQTLELIWNWSFIGQ